MKKLVKIKLVIFSFLTVMSTETFSENPVFDKGNGNNSTIAGIQNEASGDHSVAIGTFNKADGDFSAAIGNGFFNDILGKAFYNQAKAKQSSAIGVLNMANKDHSSAIGYRNIANGDFSSAIGFKNEANDGGSVAIGNGNVANKEFSVAIGQTNYSNEKISVAIGTLNKADGKNSIAIGGGYLDSKENEHYNEAISDSSIAIGLANSAKANGSLSFGAYNIASGTRASSFGFQNNASANYSSAIGFNNSAKGLYSSAIGFRNTTNGTNNSAYGSQNSVSGVNSIAFGVQNVTNNNNISILGSQYKVSGNSSGAFGVGQFTKNKYIYENEGNSSYMIGNLNKIAKNSNNNFILGNAVAIPSRINNSVVLGSYSVSGGSNTISVGSSKLQRKIVYVAKGSITQTSMDAINGSQLYSIAKATSTDIDVNAWRRKLGITSTGTRTHSENYHTEYSTFGTGTHISTENSNSATGLGSTALGVSNTVSGNYSTAIGYKNMVSGNNSGAFGDPNIVRGNGSYAFGNNNTINGNNNFVLGNNVTIASGVNNSVALGNNSTVSLSNEVSVGSATQKRKITNVADGEISATSTDAVTGKQLYNAMQNTNATAVENLRNEVSDIKNEVKYVGSLSAALSGLHPMQYDPKAPSQIIAAIGSYRNKQAIAVGMSYYFNDRFMINTGVAVGTENKVKTMANVGFTLKLGKGSGTNYDETPQYVVQNEIKRLTLENNKQAQENQELKFQINEQNERIKRLEEKLESLSNKK